MAFDPRRVFNLEVAGIVTIILSVALVLYVLFSIDECGYRHSSSRSRRTASLAGFIDLTHVFDGPLR